MLGTQVAAMWLTLVPLSLEGMENDWEGGTITGR